jgi:hypothetical protein
MSTNRDFDRSARAWLAEGPSELADRVLDAALDEVHLTQQRRRLTVPWRLPTMNTPLRLAAAIAIVAVVGYAGLTFLDPRAAPGTGPSATPTAAPTPLPTPSPISASPRPTAVDTMPLDTSTWTLFTASRYGYTVAWPNTVAWINSPATEEWAGQTAFEMWASATDAPWVDKFYDNATNLTMTAVATTIPVGTTEEAFIDGYLLPGPGTVPACTELAKDMLAILIDGHRARETTRCADQAAFVASGGRMYVFSISAENEVEFLNAYLSTVKLPSALPAAT